MKKYLTAAAAGLCAALVFGACSGEEKKPEPVETDLVLGMESDGGYTVVLDNQSTMDFTEVKIRTKSQQDFGGNMLKDGETFANEKTAALYIPAAPESEEKDKKDDKQAESCSLYFMVEDGTSWTFDSFNYDEVKDKVTLTKDDTKLKMTYTSADNDQEVVLTADEVKKAQEKDEEKTDEEKTDETSDTPENDQAPVNEDPAPADGEIEYFETPAAPVEEPVYQEPVYEQPQEPVYDVPVYTEPEPTPVPVPDPAPVPDQGSEGCLGPGFFD